MLRGAFITRIASAATLLILFILFFHWYTSNPRVPQYEADLSSISKRVKEKPPIGDRPVDKSSNQIEEEDKSAKSPLDGKPAVDLPGLSKPTIEEYSGKSDNAAPAAVIDTSPIENNKPPRSDDYTKPAKVQYIESPIEEKRPDPPKPLKEENAGGQVVAEAGECFPGRNLEAERRWKERDDKLSVGMSDVSTEHANKVKEMMMHAWTNYEKYAWGHNELAPRNKEPHSGIFSGTRIGLTIVDSLDTLWLMGLYDEVKKGKEWVVQHLPKALNVSVSVSVFEFNIRFVGGFLTMYALTNECEYKVLAKLCGDKLLPAFGTASGIPPGGVNLKLGMSGHGDTAVLSELGTLHLEFVYLSYITGDPKYKRAVEKLRDVIHKAKSDGLYGNSISIRSAQFYGSSMTVSLGGAGDSFYEYLLKSYIQSGKTDKRAKDMYFDAISAIVSKGLLQTSDSGLRYFGLLSNSRIQHRMEHLTCFTGGMVALSAEHSTNYTDTMKLAEDLASTCHEAYIRSASHIGPESFGFDKGNEAKSRSFDDHSYKLRPETVESWYILRVLTHNPKYKTWAWDFVQALENYCRVENGYAGLADVYLSDIRYLKQDDGSSKPQPRRDNTQQSFFLAETLKYLYLMFKDESLLPLDKWVFNTEAHPLPILHAP